MADKHINNYLYVYYVKVEQILIYYVGKEIEYLENK